MSIIITLIIFCIIVMIHEFGHFIVAKKCGVNVPEFAIGMGPKIFSVQKNGTLYSIRIFPIGGFCRMKSVTEVDEEKQNDSDCFENISLIKRMAVILAGPMMNFVLAFVVFFIIMLFSPIATTEISSVIEDTPAYNVGIKDGDKLLSINGHRLHIYQDLSFFMSQYNGGELNVKVKTDSGVKEFNLTPVKNEKGKYVIGIVSNIKSALTKESVDGYEKATIIDCIKTGFWYMIFMVKVTINGLLSLITAKVGIDSVAGPIGLTSQVGTVYQEVKKSGLLEIILSMANITGLLSANLGVMNLLPIPALDGCRFLFFVLEAIRGKKIPPEKEGLVHLTGFALMIILGVVIAYHDILQLI